MNICIYQFVRICELRHNISGDHPVPSMLIVIVPSALRISNNACIYPISRPCIPFSNSRNCIKYFCLFRILSDQYTQKDYSCCQFRLHLHAVHFLLIPLAFILNITVIRLLQHIVFNNGSKDY